MFELPSAIFSIADGNEFRFARFYIVCEAVPLGTLREFAHCLRFVGHILRSVKAWQETQNVMQSAAWKKYSNFASKIYRRLLHFGTRHLQARYDKPAASVSVPLICQSSVSVFHLPEGCGVRRERTATSKVVRLPGEQVNSCAAACVEMRREAFGICVDGD